jgi:Domain of unknown function (DUF4405)
MAQTMRYSWYGWIHMTQPRALNLRTYFRAVVAIALMVVWSLVTFSGILLWLAPPGPRAGYRVLLFGLTKRGWGEVHLWFSFAALAVTAVHLVIDWRGFCGCLNYLASVHRSSGPVEGSSRSASANASQERATELRVKTHDGSIDRILFYGDRA